MNNIRHQTSSLRILYFGTHNSFSLPPLLALLRAGQHVVGIVIPETPQQSELGENTFKLLPAATNDTIVSVARTHGIPVWTLSSLPVMLEFELLVVACFPKRIPQSLLNQGDVASLNIHPSLLPQYRGPAPLFWQLRDGMREIGVTLHHVTSQIDGGDIVTQTKVALPTGISGSAADELLASAGTDMLLDTIQSGDYSGRSQSGPESYHSWPRVLDWNVPTSWKVLHAFNFMRGVSEWGQSFKLLAYPKTLTARYASDFTRGKSSPGTVRVSKAGGQEVGFADGWLHIC